MIGGLVLNCGILFLGAAILRWLALRALCRIAPVWAEGPEGYLIETQGRLGLLQMHQTRHRPACGGADTGRGCD